MSIETLIENAVKEAAERHLRQLGLVQPEYLSVAQAAEYTGFSKTTLDIWRSRGDGPPYVKLAQAVRYKRTDLDEWFASRKRG